MRTGAASINCTQCGAGLDVLGGGRVRAHVCSYCGAELDAQDGYRVLAQFRDMERPASPFRPGMEGALWGVPFTVIGTIGWEERFAGQVWRWVDHQVYSPTHGYAWLSVEDGWITFVRKSRIASRPAGLSGGVIEGAEHRPSVSHDGQTYRYYASGHATPVFIEGEFNYKPDIEDRIRYVSLLGGEGMLDIVETAGEREYEISRLPDQAEVLESFGVPPGARPRPRGVHPLSPLERSPLQLFARNLFLAAAVLAVLLGLFASTMGREVARSAETGVGEALSLPFEVTAGNRLTEIEIWADAYNSWVWFEGELLDGDGDPVAGFERGVEYYRGSDWSEGSQRGRTRLRLEPGAYRLELAMTGAEVDWTGGREARRMQVTVREGVANATWLWGAAVLFGVLGGAFLGHRVFHFSRRMSGSDWSDD